jgi:rhamnose transport system permease protein
VRLPRLGRVRGSGESRLPYRGRPGWNLGLAALIVLVAAWASVASPLFLDAKQIMGGLAAVIVSGILALGLTPVVIAGEIDISLTSNLAMSTVVLGLLSQAGTPGGVLIATALATGLVLGLVNGLLVANLGLPSLAVTLGTMGAYEGLGYIVGGNAGFSKFPPGVASVGTASVGPVPVSVALFAALAGLLGILLRSTSLGRLLYGVGRGADALRFSAVAVERVKLAAFGLAGLFAGLAAVVFVGFYGSGGADSAAGSILIVVTMVVLGGVDIYGGSGGVLGVVLAVILMGLLANGMGLVNISATVQTIVVGCILIATIAAPTLLRRGRPAPRWLRLWD